MDCAQRRLAQLATTYYDSTGQVAHDAHIAEPRWSYVVPESVGEEFAGAFCDAVEGRSRAPHVWIIRSGRITHWSHRRATLDTTETLVIESFTDDVHSVTVDTLSIGGEQRRSAARLLAILGDQRVLNERGDLWTVLGLYPGRYSIFCDGHPDNPYERLALTVVASRRQR